MEAVGSSSENELAARFSLDTEITGYSVEALDGPVGRVDAATYELGTPVIVVEISSPTGSRRVVLRSSAVELVDTTDEKVWVQYSRAQVESAPEHGASRIVARAAPAGDAQRGEQL